MRRLLRALSLVLALALPTITVSAEPPAILLAEVYRNQVDVAQYLVSEKLDGVRAIWDGQILRFRSGKTINAPRWFLDGLPKTPLDGELWIGRGTFERLSGIVRRNTPDDAEWRQIRYRVFELPDAPGNFSERMKQLQVLTAGRAHWLQPAEQFRLADAKALKRKLDEVVKGGGEGLMLHRADAYYETGRSAALLKLTPWQDAEARVVAHLPGKGKYAGMTGALQMEMPDGRRFALGSGLSDALRRKPPPVGTLVTYRYRELTQNGMPRFPRYLRVRDRL